MTISQQTIALRTSDETLLDIPESELHAQLQALDWNFTGADTALFTHGIHSYPAKFIPQIPGRLITLLSEQEDLVVDPFSGGGTTGVEAIRLGRQFVGVDANPIAVLLGRVKTTPLTAYDHEELLALLHTIRENSDPRLGVIKNRVPPIPNISKWYSPTVISSLSRMKDAISRLDCNAGRDVALLAFANTAARVSFQESETRYVSKPRPIALDQPAQTFAHEMKRITEALTMLNHLTGTPQSEFRLGDARDSDTVEIAPRQAGLVVTSPPYPNAYDYHLYHRFRLFWLGMDPSSLRQVEIGSHLKHQRERDPAKSYESDMAKVLGNAYDITMPGRYCAMVIGNGVYRGQEYHTARNLSKIAEAGGWSVLPPITRHLPRNRRSVTSAGRRLMSEEILLLRRPTSPSYHIHLTLAEPNYKRFPYETVLAQREVAELVGTTVSERDRVVVENPRASDAISELRGLAFWHSVRISDGEVAEVPTLQRLLEDPNTGNRKHSTYVTHGLHRYKGKFYPQLAKALLNLSSLPSRQALVLDPFGGSGTVLLESVICGHDAISIDCNPLATAVARCKIDVLDVDLSDLCHHSESLIQRLLTLGVPTTGYWDQFHPSTHEELAKWFAPSVLAKLGHTLELARGVPQPTLVPFYEVIISDLIREVSQQEPRDLRIRRRATEITDAPVIDIFVKRVRTQVGRIAAYHSIADCMKPIRGTGEAILGSSADTQSYASLDNRRRLVDCVVSSPPYATALPYIDTDRLSLAAIYSLDRSDRRAIEQILIGSRETSTREVRDCEDTISSQLSGRLPQSTEEFLQELLSATRADPSAGFRKRQLPTALLKYFLGVSRVMQQLQPRVRPGAHLWFVLGNSKTTLAGTPWVIPTVRQFTEIAVSNGFELVEQIPISVTREDLAHSKNSIIKNTIVHLRAGS